MTWSLLAPLFCFALALPIAAGAEQPAKERRHIPQLADGRLEPADSVFGIVVGEEPRAYALADLREAGAAVHDIVGGTAVEIGLAGSEPEARRGAAPIAAGEKTSWRSWTREHPDTSLWRPPAVAEPEVVRAADEIRVQESHGYRTVIGCAMSQGRLAAANMEPPGLYVISGTIENTAAKPVHHVVLRYELVDGNGKVVYRDEGFNRSAEALAAPKSVDGGEVVPIAAGASDSFRMILLSDELPDFETPRVTVIRVY